MHAKFWSENEKGKDHLGDLVIRVWAVAAVEVDIGCKSVDWIHLAQDII
jgi:hypothetical protein